MTDQPNKSVLGWTFHFQKVYLTQSLILWVELVHSHTQKGNYSAFFKTINVFTDRNWVGFCL